MKIFLHKHQPLAVCKADVCFYPPCRPYSNCFGSDKRYYCCVNREEMKEDDYMKLTYIYESAYLIEWEHGIFSQEDRADLDKETLEAISSDITLKNGQKLNWISTHIRLLDPDRMNCGRCKICGRWTTDKNMEDPIPSLRDGARVNNRLLCYECLPRAHRWIF